MIELRDYQEQAIFKIRNEFKNLNKKVVLCLPTGAGKTIVFTSIAKATLDKSLSNTVIVLTDRTELLNQTGGAFAKFGMNPINIAPNARKINLHGRCYVGMVKTIYNRKNKLQDLFNRVTLVIIDEAHKGDFVKVLNLFPNAHIIGATATPIMTGKRAMQDYYNSIVVGTDVSELIENGYLSNYTHYAPKGLDITQLKSNAGEYSKASQMQQFGKAELYEGLISNYKKYGRGKGIIFCVNKEHAQKTASEFTKAGYNAKCLISGCSDSYRKATLDWFANTEDAILTNCGILTTGFNEPSIQTVVLNRATKSLPLFMQMIGRGSRTTSGKNEFIVIDMGNNHINHGLWDNARNWDSFFSGEHLKKSKKKQAAPIKDCPKCAAIIIASAARCTHCGFVFPKVKKELQVAKDLEAVNYGEIPEHLNKPFLQMSVHELIERAKYGSSYLGRPYKKTWIVRQCKNKGRKALEQYAEIMGYSDKWVDYQC